MVGLVLKDIACMSSLFITTKHIQICLKFGINPLLCFFVNFREIGNGSWDSWTMPLLDQVVMLHVGRMKLV